MRFLACILLLLTFSTYAIEQIELSPKNSVLLRGEVNYESMTKMSARLLELSNSLPQDTIIYLVIDSPGGMIIAGLDAIEALKLIPQKIHTISLFAASMGFVLSQQGEKRYITEMGIMMGHRAKGGFQGQFETGEIESQLGLWKTIVRTMEERVAKRMGISLERYKEMVINELWMLGSQAIKENAADDIAQIKCTKELIEETEEITQMGFFSASTEIYSKCPLLRSPIGKVQTKEEQENRTIKKYF